MQQAMLRKLMRMRLNRLASPCNSSSSLVHCRPSISTQSFSSRHNVSIQASTVPDADLLRVAKLAAKAGADVVMAAVDKPRRISYKGETDLVTETDKAAEEAILAVLLQEFPDHAVLGEEGGVSKSNGDVSGEFLWVVDPVDGTTNFAHSYPSFGVSVGVLRRGTPAAGVVVEFTGGPGVWVNRTFEAQRGGGAFCNGKPVRVSSTTELNRSLLVTGFGYDHDAAWATNIELFKEFTDVTQGVRRLGAASVDLCHVALGVVDGYWEFKLKPWDVTAGVLIAQEAGAKITTMDGRPYSVFDRTILVSNTALHSAMLDRTRVKTKALLADGFDLSRWWVPDGYNVAPV